MDNKEYQLIMENWRSFINTSQLDEGLIDSLKSFIANKITSSLNKLSNYLSQDAVALNQSEVSIITSQNPQLKEIYTSLANAGAQLKSAVSQIKTNKTTNQPSNQNNTQVNTQPVQNQNTQLKEELDKLIKQFETFEKSLLEEKKLNEFGGIEVAGLGLGALGLCILILKGLIMACQKMNFSNVAAGLKKVLQTFEFIEQKIKNFITRLKVFDAASYQILKLFLVSARKNMGGKLHQRFVKAGVKLLVNPKYKIPPLQAMLNPDNFVSWDDLGHHIDHSFPQAGGQHGNVHEEKTKVQKAQIKKSSQLAEQLKKETKILVSMNQKIVWSCILGFFVINGFTSLFTHGVHGVVGAAEAVATGVKVGETTPAVMAGGRAVAAAVG